MGQSTSLQVIQHSTDTGTWLHNDGIKLMATKQCFPMNLGHFDFFGLSTSFTSSNQLYYTRTESSGNFNILFGNLETKT